MDRFPHPFLLERGPPLGREPSRKAGVASFLARGLRWSRSLSQAEMQVLEKQGHIWLALHPQQCFAQVLAQSPLGAGLLKRDVEHSSWPWSQHDSICPGGFDLSIGVDRAPASHQSGAPLILPKQHPPLLPDLFRKQHSDFPVMFNSSCSGSNSSDLGGPEHPRFQWTCDPI